MYIRVPTPTYEFAVGTGAAVTPRRAIADTSACLKCHVGSLYQHGNTRVDNVTMCIICHNSASSEQNVRTQMGVTASEAYDGKPGQTYEFKTILHKLHKSGETGSEPIVIYRTRGIYAWGPRFVARELGDGAVREDDPDHDAGIPGLRFGSGAGRGLPGAQLLRADLSAGRERLRGLPQGGLRQGSGPGQGRGNDARRRCCAVGQPARRYPAGRRLRLPARAATRTAPPRAMPTRMAGSRRRSKMVARPSSMHEVSNRLPR